MSLPSPSLLLFLLLPFLSNDDFRTREAVSASLRSFDLMALPALEHGVGHPDPEIRHRCRALIVDVLSVFPTNYRVPPWIDMLPDDYPNRQGVIDKLLFEVRGGNGYYCSNGPEEDWSDFRLATAILVENERRSGKSREEVRSLLDRMVERERKWFVGAGKSIPH